MASDDIKNIKVTQEMIDQAQRNAMSGIIDADHPELTVKILKENAAEFRKKFAEEIKKLKFEQLGKKLQEELLLDAKKELRQKQNFWQRIGFTDKNQDDLSTQYRARQRAGGIEAILSGNISGGLRQLGSTIPKIANFMSGGLYLAMTALARATLQAVDAFYKFKIESSRISGGATDELGNRYKRNFQKFVISSAFGQSDKDFDKFAVQNIGWGGRHNIWSNDRSFNNLINSWGFTRAGFQQIGANPEQANNLLAQQRSINMDARSVTLFNYRLIEATKTLDKLGSEKFISNYEELNKTLIANNINGMASAKMFAKFEDQLNKGTLTVADFTKGLTSRRGAETSTLAGVGAMLAERGLGGKELQEAYARGDMIAVAGAVRRGGMSMQRDIEKIAPEIAQQFGTTDFKEALALQSGTPWGQLTGDLKNMEVQNLIVKGGSLTIGIDRAASITPEEKAAIKDYEKKLIGEQNQGKGFWQTIGEIFKLGYKGTASFIEQNPGTATAVLGAMSPLTGGAVTPIIIKNIFTVGSPNNTTTE